MNLNRAQIHLQAAGTMQHGGGLFSGEGEVAHVVSSVLERQSQCSSAHLSSVFLLLKTASLDVDALMH